MVVLDEDQGIIKVSTIHHQGTMNVCTLHYMGIHPTVVKIFQSYPK